MERGEKIKVTVRNILLPNDEYVVLANIGSQIQSSWPNYICDVNHRPTGSELLLLAHDQLFFSGRDSRWSGLKRAAG